MFVLFSMVIEADFAIASLCASEPPRVFMAVLLDKSVLLEFVVQRSISHSLVMQIAFSSLIVLGYSKS